MTGTEIALALQEIGPIVKAGITLTKVMKSWIEDAFNRGVITKEEQDNLMSQVNAWGVDASNDKYPDSWMPQ